MIGSDKNGFLAVQLQAITWTNGYLLLIWTLGKNFREIWINWQIEIIFIYENTLENVWKMSFCLGLWYAYSPRPLFTKRMDVLLQDLMNSQSHKIGCYNHRTSLKFDRHLGSNAAEVPVKFQSGWKSLNLNLAASTLY